MYTLKACFGFELFDTIYMYKVSYSSDPKRA